MRLKVEGSASLPFENEKTMAGKIECFGPVSAQAASLRYVCRPPEGSPKRTKERTAASGPDEDAAVNRLL